MLNATRYETCKGLRIVKWIPIFKGGQQTDSSGNTKVWTDEELDAVVRQYEDRTEDAPVVIGHPKDNAPAFAWVDGLKRVGQTLMATFKDVDEQFKNMVNKGRFKYRSVAFYPDLKLRHVGFLGAAAPAVKGLGPVQFDEESTYTEVELEFDEPRANVLSRFFTAVQDVLRDMPELADGPVTSTETESDDPDHEPETENNDPDIKEGAMPEIQVDEPTADEVQEYKDQLAAKEQENATLKQELAEHRAKLQRATFNEFCDELEADGKELTPKSRTAIVEFMESIATVGEFEFTSGDDTQKVKPVQQFQSLLKDGLEFMTSDEEATKDKAVPGQASAKVEQLIHDEMDKNELQYHDAYAKVMRENPELKQAYDQEISA